MHTESSAFAFLHVGSVPVALLKYKTVLTTLFGKVAVVRDEHNIFNARQGGNIVHKCRVSLADLHLEGQLGGSLSGGLGAQNIVEVGENPVDPIRPAGSVVDHQQVDVALVLEFHQNEDGQADEQRADDGDAVNPRANTNARRDRPKQKDEVHRVLDRGPEPDN